MGSKSLCMCQGDPRAPRHINNEEMCILCTVQERFGSQFDVLFNHLASQGKGRELGIDEVRASSFYASRLAHMYLALKGQEMMTHVIDFAKAGGDITCTWLCKDRR
eukprot:1158225-Pelagomonas_calceolata.AAC.9